MTDSVATSGPLSGYRIIELAGLGALPFATQKLADMGADVIRVSRTSEVPAEPGPQQVWREYDRGRRSIAVDLKQPAGVDLVLDLAAQSDVLLEAFRPGVTERLGLGPDVVMARNPRLVYGRLTGWGQSGPLAHVVGHSLNYESLTGAIGAIGSPGGAPVPLLQVIGDFAGGGMHLAYGVVCALLEAARTGKGQIVDAAMVDGVMSLFSVYYSMTARGLQSEAIGTNLFDGGAPFYSVYETADRRYVSVAAIEPHFWQALLTELGIDPSSLPGQHDQTQWAVLRERLATVFRTRTRDEWQAALGDKDVCVAPVMRFGEAAEHPHTIARGSFVDTPGGGRQVRPAPRLSGMADTAEVIRPAFGYVGADTDTVLAEYGLDHAAISALRAAGTIA